MSYLKYFNFLKTNNQLCLKVKGPITEEIELVSLFIIVFVEIKNIFYIN